jgi:hypothetical protein
MKSTEIAESLRAKREAAQVLFAKGDDITTEEFASVKSLMEEIKGLDADMKAVTRAKHRADPFSVVALLITHESRLPKRMLDDYEAEALRLGKAHALPEPVVRQQLKLLDQHGIATTARQLVWFVPPTD